MYAIGMWLILGCQSNISAVKLLLNHGRIVIDYASTGKELLASVQVQAILLIVNLLQFYQIYKKTLHMFVSCQRKRLFNRKIIKVGL